MAFGLAILPTNERGVVERQSVFSVGDALEVWVEGARAR
jgi:hypothetical protein